MTFGHIAKFLLTPDIFREALCLPEGTKIRYVAMELDGRHITVCVEHEDLKEATEDGIPECLPHYIRAEGASKFTGWGQKP